MTAMVTIFESRRGDVGGFFREGGDDDEEVWLVGGQGCKLWVPCAMTASGTIGKTLTPPCPTTTFSSNILSFEGFAYNQGGEVIQRTPSLHSR